ncbi:beta-lactamase-like protein 2 [Stylonychia lemnae]|uniref:Beta-lactamase-like protein 2 n=1 Tax=Stylonychia lemnae TaxID=5949 RepID=A0A078ALA6_STYLE|nr:beta-lactamase-like protein 2 [Stylonychia lemnae]|eukprot:CDW82984.1 beta-lactamase-like protein 2 [Stylonychia lemnae]
MQQVMRQTASPNFATQDNKKQLTILKKEDQLIYQQLDYNIFHIPGENPSNFLILLRGFLDAATLLGTNCFILGSGVQRTMIDCGDMYPLNMKLMDNLLTLMKNENFIINKLFITHAIPNHFGGAWSVIEAHQKLNVQPPTVFKHLDGNDYEIEVFHNTPQLREHVKHINDGDQFKIDEISDSLIRVIRTPGHRKDHCSFGFTSNVHKYGLQNILFPGDMILGTPSVSMDHLDQYINDLKRTRAMAFEKLYLVHTNGMDHADIVVDANKKFADYLDYRYNRLNNMIEFIESQQDLKDTVRMRLVLTCFNSHIEKLRQDGIIEEEFSEVHVKNDKLGFKYSLQ